jgi:hypothetical protein
VVEIWTRECADEAVPGGTQVGTCGSGAGFEEEDGGGAGGVRDALGEETAGCAACGGGGGG